MAFTNYTVYRDAVPYANIPLGKSSLGSLAGRMSSTWTNTPFAGGAGAAAACDYSTTGSLNRGFLNGLATWVKTARYSRCGGATILVLDRLAHQSGLSGTVTTTQTTNLPTAALTRYTSGVGVMAFIECYSTIGATSSTATVSYTNQAGTPGQTSPSVTLGNTGDRATGVFIPIPLAVGDTGFRSVESVLLSGTTGAAGNFGVTLVKPLLIIPAWDEAYDFRYDQVQNLGALFASVEASACLMTVICCSDGDTFFKTGSLEMIKQV